MMADETTRPGYRGKCLYKTGKCNNERALKTSGQAHNLCDEHRHRQNEHQRKLDAKNRYARKDKNSDNSGGGSKDASPTNLQRARYAPYGAKVRMSPNAAGAEDMHALLTRNAMMGMSFHPLPGDAMAASNAAAAAAAASQMVGMGEMMANGGAVLLPGAPPQPAPTHVPYPMPMQDFDGIIVPLPSYLEGHERNEIRARVFQKVMDFIAEECVRRYGVPPNTNANANGISGGGGGVVKTSVDTNAPTDANNQPQQLQQQHQTNANEEQETPSDVGAVAGDDANTTARGKSRESTDSDSSIDKHEEMIKDVEDDHADVDDASRSKRATRGRVSRKDV